jgi:hypothetical protein
VIERLGLTSDADLQTALREIATVVDWPKTPEISSGLSARMVTTSRKTSWTRRGLFQPSLSRALLPAALLALLLAGAAIGVRFGLELLQIEFGRVPTPAPTTPASPPDRGHGATLGLGSRTTLDVVETNAGFPISIPTDPGVPNEVYLGGPQLRGQVAFVYAPREDLPPTDLLNGAGLLITQNHGSVDPGLARKVIDTGGAVDRVTVGDVPGYWITGIAHGFWYLAPDGEVIFESGRRVGNTLAWQRGDILYRIEGAITLERALQIAESMP